MQKLSFLFICFAWSEEESFLVDDEDDDLLSSFVDDKDDGRPSAAGAERLDDNNGKDHTDDDDNGGINVTDNIGTENSSIEVKDMPDQDDYETLKLTPPTPLQTR